MKEQSNDNCTIEQLVDGKWTEIEAPQKYDAAHALCLQKIKNGIADWSLRLITPIGTGYFTKYQVLKEHGVVS